MCGAFWRLTLSQASRLYPIATGCPLTRDDSEIRSGVIALERIQVLVHRAALPDRLGRYRTNSVAGGDRNHLPPFFLSESSGSAPEAGCSTPGILISNGLSGYLCGLTVGHE